ncbi:DUF4232 domain-containing protein [Nocardia sp. NPDC051570]|uniref:DUF4232 domain-containing protein n=1 Tax=Nocardia sp. NPDC051570 TaxID=3364324 RepID=UPI0037B8DE78
MRRRSFEWLLVTVCVAAAVAGCGSEKSATPSAGGGQGSGAPASVGPTGGGGSIPGTAVTPPSGSPSVLRPEENVVPQCHTADLSANIGQESAAAGTVGIPIIFTNNGSGPCIIQGFPGVSYANGPDSAPVGAPAARDGASGGPVQLVPGGQASALVLAVNVHNFPNEQCAPVSVPGLRIYPPDNTASVYLERTGTACGLAQSITSQLKIRAVVAGATGQ